jgi:HSP20 family protein
MNRCLNTTLISLLVGFGAAVLIFQSFAIYNLNRKVNELETAAVIENQISSAPQAPSSPRASQFNLNDPFFSMRQMQRDIDELLNSAFQGPGSFSSGGFFATAATPSINLEESSDRYEITLDVPAESELELSTEIEDNTVILAGTISSVSDSLTDGLTSSFTSRSQFSRSIPLPKPIDPLGLYTEKQGDKIKITLPKS